MAKVGQLKRGDVVFIYNVTGHGHEMKKDRFAVVISNGAACKTYGLLQVVYLSKNHKRHGFYNVPLNNDRVAICNQIYSVDVSRLRYVGERIPVDEMRKIDKAVEKQLQLDPIHRI